MEERSLSAEVMAVVYSPEGTHHTEFDINGSTPLLHVES